jgi:hypothetical protein
LQSSGASSYTHVSYKGSAGPALDVVSGQIVMTIETISPLLPHIRRGPVEGARRNRKETFGPAACHTDDRRSRVARVRIVNWYGLLAPAASLLQSSTG